MFGRLTPSRTPWGLRDALASVSELVTSERPWLSLSRPGPPAWAQGRGAVQAREPLLAAGRTPGARARRAAAPFPVWAPRAPRPCPAAGWAGRQVREVALGPAASLFSVLVTLRSVSIDHSVWLCADSWVSGNHLRSSAQGRLGEMLPVAQPTRFPPTGGFLRPFLQTCLVL